MKKAFITVSIMAVLLLCLTACGGGSTAESKNNQNASSESSNESTGAIQVDENLLTVDVTLAASFFEDTTEEEIKEGAEKAGYNSYKINDDGSVTYTMTKAKRNEMLKEYKSQVDDTINDLLNGDEKVGSFTKIDYNDNLSEFTIYVDSDKYSMWDSFHVFTFYILGAYYQNFAGVNSDDVDVIVNFLDKDTNEVVNSASYRSFMEKSSDQSTNADEQAIATSDSTPLSEKETVTIDDVCEFFVDYTNITNDVIPPSPSRMYSHYEADAGRKYVDVCISYKNLSTSSVGADNVCSATLIFAGKYQFTGFSMIEEDSRGDFTYSNITSISPLSTEYLHYLFEITDEIAESNGKIVANISIGSNVYTLTVREGETGDVISPSSNAIAKTSGIVKQGEIIAIPNTCEFYIDYSDITNDVIPKNPARMYSHYEADAGKVYVDVCFSYKNWQNKRVSADDVISAKLTYSDKYEYSGFSMIEEDNRGDFTYSNITSISPLCTEFIHYLFEVPDEVSDSTEPISISFTIGQNTYSYSVR